MATVLAAVLACAAVGRAAATCSDDALHAVDQVDVYLKRGDTARAMDVYERAANAALACATRQRSRTAHDALVRAAADDYRSAADIARTAKVNDRKPMERRWYAESSRLYRSLMAERQTDKATRAELAAEATSNDDFVAAIDRGEAGVAAVVRDPHGAMTVPVWSTLRRFCRQLTSLRAGRTDDVAGSEAVAFVASGTAVTREAPRSVDCPGGESLALVKVRMTAGAMLGHEGWTLGEDLQMTDVASIAGR